MLVQKITEEEFLRQVIQFARLKRWRVAHFRPAMTKAGHWITAVQGDGKGFPDLVLVRDRIMVAELKVGKNKPSLEQEQWLAAFEGAGIASHVWRPELWAEIERALE